MPEFEIPRVNKGYYILMIAPQPWFQPRGTPFSVLHRIRALTLLGHNVDLATYHVGQNIQIERLKILRATRVPFIKNVKIGPSVVKIILDLALYRHANRLARHGKYDLVHTHEEASFFGVNLARKNNLPHLYDMHSSLPQQLHNFKYSKSKILSKIFESLEKRTITNADAMITICPELQSYVEEKFPGKTSILIENVADNSLVFPPNKEQAQVLKARYGLGDCRTVLYYGTLEAYQGIQLLIDSAQYVIKKSNDKIRILIVGGHPEQVKKYQRLIEEKGLESYFILTGFVEPQLIPAFIDIADVLVSPRISGTNSPLKIYSYLRSGRPVVATRHITHTQVLNEQVAILVEPEADAFANGILRAINEHEESAELVKSATRLAEEKYSYSDYLRKTQWIVEQAISNSKTIPLQS